ncbi:MULTISPECIES: hypothetical protein [unclassified Bradyrhizobium]|uniref:hypothetical protein n=2 Tax=Bradyrhizobium TaxID=374 RepID=UPI0028EF27A8|nr:MULTISPECIES: hypothetical protein [unclassified Bradyrhizobium]
MSEDREVTAARGRRAQELLDDDLLKDAFKALEEGYVSAWRTTAVDNVTGREKLFLAINVVGKVKDHLTKVAADGRLAAAEIKAMADEHERRKRFGIL